MSASDGADRKKVQGELAACDRAFNISWYLAMVFLLLGVIGDAAKVTLGLQPASWFMLLIAALLAAIIFRMGWAVAWYLKTAK